MIQSNKVQVGYFKNCNPGELQGTVNASNSIIGGNIAVCSKWLMSFIILLEALLLCMYM